MKSAATSLTLVLADGLLPAKKGSTTMFVPLIFRENVA
jgi:hypothetical protein